MRNNCKGLARSWKLTRPHIHQIITPNQNRAFDPE